MRNSTNKRNFSAGVAQTGLKFLSCNRSLYFTTILVFCRAEISSRDKNAPCNHPPRGRLHREFSSGAEFETVC